MVPTVADFEPVHMQPLFELQVSRHRDAMYALLCWCLRQAAVEHWQHCLCWALHAYMLLSQEVFKQDSICVQQLFYTTGLHNAGCSCKLRC